MIIIKIVLATNTLGFKDELERNLSEIDMYQYDFSSEKDLISFLKKEKSIDILITGEKIKMEESLEEYLKNVRKVSPDINVIYICNECNITDKNKLFKYNVFNIIEGEKINFSILKDMLIKNKNIVFKSIENDKKNIISVFGTSSSGKSTIAYSLAKGLSEKNKTLLVDMDIQNSAIDIFLGEEKNNTNILDVIENFSAKTNDQYIIESLSKKENLYSMLSNISFYEFQNKLNANVYKNILKFGKNNFDYTVIDLTNCIYMEQVKYFIVNSAYIIFIINPNYISVRQGIKYLEIIKRLWNTPNERIKLIINKNSPYSLNIEIIKRLLPEYEILDIITYNDKLEDLINSGYCNTKYIELDKSLNLFGIKKPIKDWKKKFNIYAK